MGRILQLEKSNRIIHCYFLSLPKARINEKGWHLDTREASGLAGTPHMVKNDTDEPKREPAATLRGILGIVRIWAFSWAIGRTKVWSQ